MSLKSVNLTITGVALLVVQFSALAGSYERVAEDFYPMRVFWGDTHVHTSLSQDSASRGNVSIGPDEAFRFASGEPVIADDGKTYQLERRLDFLVVSDHAEYLGLLRGLRDRDPLLMASPGARRWADLLAAGNIVQVFREYALDMSGNTRRVPADESRGYDQSIWRHAIEAAERNNRPGAFTAFIGYEWTSMPNDGDNLHRVLVFRDGRDQAGRVLPFSSFDSKNPEDLWAYMRDYESRTGGRVLAIPHNMNLSGGLMFKPEAFDGSAIDSQYAAQRARWEPLVEVTQTKGDSETHPFLSPEDEFAPFEKWDKANILGRTLHQDSWFRFEYVRAALKEGLRQQTRLGVNPFKFGMIGSTDSHTGLSTADEDYFLGKFPSTFPRSNRWQETLFVPGTGGLKVNYAEWEMAAAGYAGVWAQANTREALFDAMARREVFATTGPRIELRLFASFDFNDGDVYRPDYIRIGYRRGVPMGGTLKVSGGEGRVPKLLVTALKDPFGANLDRIQIVKGWLAEDGSLHEKVFDVAWSEPDRRRKDNHGRVTAVGSSVDVANAAYTNTIGAAQLVVQWEDADFDPRQPAFYYARVIQIPTPRWTTYDMRAFGNQMPDRVPRTIQERAYSSPIWYEPPGGASNKQ